tara:strand:- start:4259 stop:5245 length:987 start_codon:yes stop_codon:yes gene_type:complete
MGLYESVKEGMSHLRRSVGRIFVSGELDGLEKEVRDYKMREDDLILRAVEAEEVSEGERGKRVGAEREKAVAQRNLGLARESHSRYKSRIFELEDGLGKTLEDLSKLEDKYDSLEGEAKTHYGNRLLAEQERDELKEENKAYLRSAGHLKRAVRDSRIAERDMASKVRDAELLLKGLINYNVENGINPLTEERNGRYAFIDETGKITALSKRAQGDLGYEPGEVNYRNVFPNGLGKLGEIEKETVLPSLRIKAKGIGEPFEIKNLKISPLRIGRGYFGSVIDFEKLSRMERIRNYFNERRTRAARKAVREGISKITKGFDDKLDFGRT